MLVNLPLRVESDPMGVPLAASMSTGRDESFETVLQEAVDTEPAAEAAAGPHDEADAGTPATPPVVEPPAGERAQDAAAAVADDANATTADAAAIREQVAANADVTETTRRGEPGRQAIAGKGTDSPRSSPSPANAEPLLAAAIGHGAAAAPNGPALAGAANVVGTTGVLRSGQAPAAGVDGAWQKANLPARAAAAVAGYRTDAAASARLLEQARDSVFQQILMKLDGDGGEVRMRLDPPELGELDLRMVVEGGNKLSLSICAERLDLAHLLQRHLDELKQTLQRAGLEVTDAHVSAREGGSRDARDPDSRRRDGGESEPRSTFLRPRSGGYVTAEGLDFWV